MLKPGEAAPDFSLPDADMKMVELSDFKGKQNVVLYFYPKDNTSGCTLEAIDFSDMEEDFAALDTVVLGVSKDDCASHASFRDKHGLAVQLLADIDGEICEDYGVWQEKETEGIKNMGIVRSTFIIDKKGIIRHALYGVNAKSHAVKVLQLAKEMN